MSSSGSINTVHGGLIHFQSPFTSPFTRLKYTTVVTSSFLLEVLQPINSPLSLFSHSHVLGLPGHTVPILKPRVARDFCPNNILPFDPRHLLCRKETVATSPDFSSLHNSHLSESPHPYLVGASF